jgi:hypothetical protein
MIKNSLSRLKDWRSLSNGLNTVVNSAEAMIGASCHSHPQESGRVQRFFEGWFLNQRATPIT